MPDYGNRRIFNRVSNFRYPQPEEPGPSTTHRIDGVFEKIHTSTSVAETMSLAEDVNVLLPQAATDSMTFAETVTYTITLPTFTVEFTAPDQTLSFIADGRWAFEAPPKTLAFTAPADSELDAYVSDNQGE